MQFERHYNIYLISLSTMLYFSISTSKLLKSTNILKDALLADINRG